ncbi:MAG: RdgB/HAM1 family non-canonical purine NTP pyrophosphatase [Kiloniellaceae bacterium]
MSATVGRAPRRLAGETVVIASHNPGKVSEIADLLAPYRVRVVSAAARGLPEPEETGTTFAANARIKAAAAARAADAPALADDSGLAVAALDGRPGIRSARWAGPDKDFAVAMGRVEAELKKAGATDRRGAFVCSLCLAWPDGAFEVFEGRVEGKLVWPPRGTRGFGYDPMFVPAGFELTFGEMEPAAKHAVSHRARAFAKMIARVLASAP